MGPQLAAVARVERGELDLIVHWTIVDRVDQHQLATR
jgi:hypothetical protein